MQTVFNTLSKLLILSIFSIVLGGCSSFKFPWAYYYTIRQGNFVDKEMFEQLEVGMSKKQVRFILGTPLVQDTFNLDEWHYLFAIRRDEKDILNYRLSVYFDEDKLTRWDGDLDRFKSEKEGIEEDAPINVDEKDLKKAKKESA